MRKQRGWADPVWFALELMAVLIGLYIIMSWGDAKADIRTPTRAQLVAHASKMEILHRLPSGVLRAICEQESNWRNVAGRHGEIGVCQVKPDTVRMICECSIGPKQVLIRRGWTGDEVARIQAELTRGGFYAARIDGVYGPHTERAVAALQSVYGLRSDGVVGPITWALLFGGEVYPSGTIEAALWDPLKNIEWAAAYLAWLQRNVSDDPVVMLAAYNGGPGNPVVRYVVGVKARMERHALKEAM